MKKIHIAIKFLSILLIFTVFPAGCAGSPENAEKIANNAAAAENGTFIQNVDAATTNGSFSNVIGTYTTEYKEGTSGRIHNIKLAASKINGAVIPAGKTFSFNDTVGSTNKAAGFKKARIFVNGKDAEGYGGGVCQISSTLHAAALNAGLEIIERHPHSKSVGYIPEGMDAATSQGGGADLKFKNNTAGNLTISSTAAEGKVIINILA